MKIITVHLKNKYPILIGRNLLSEAGNYLKRFQRGSKVLIVTNKKVGSRYTSVIKNSLEKEGYQTWVFRLPFGDERDKSIKVLNCIWVKMAEIPLDRSSAVVSLGGGVCGDVTGFAASAYMRGISLVHIPTTLLAQVDSSIGGKTAVDLPQAKNIVGSFHQPRLVISDVMSLATLNHYEIKNQLAEVIKYGIIQDPELFGLLEKKLGWFLSSVSRAQFGPREYDFLEQIVYRSASIKAWIVEEDEKEIKGKRMILNYGHTFAHALEGASGYKMAHGHAVAIGMVMAGELACRLGIFSPKEQFRQVRVIQKLGLSLKSSYSASRLLPYMRRDKKVKNGKLRFVLPICVGKVKIVEVSEGAVKNLFLKGK